MLVGGLVAFGAYKMSTRDAERVEEHTGIPPEEMDDQELEQAMGDLNIERETVSAEDREEGPGQASSPSGADTSGAKGLDELERLAELRDQGILSEEEFTAKKRQILGLD